MTSHEDTNLPLIRVSRPGMPDVVLTKDEWKVYQRELPAPVPPPLNRAQRRNAARRRALVAGGES